MWWMRRRDQLLAQLAALLACFGADLLEDPGADELARTAAALAAEYEASERGAPIHQAGSLLRAAAAELCAADRFRGTLLPVVNRHLRSALGLLLEARACLDTGADPAGGRPRAGAAR
jgi:hypothetical protein